VTRGLGAAALAAIQGEVVTCTRAVELLFDSGAVRLSAATVPLTIAGQVFHGVGILGGISTVQEEADLRSAGLTLTLAGVPADVAAVALAEPYHDKPATVWEVILGADGQVIEAIICFRGRIDQMNILLGDTATVEVTLEDRLTDMDSPNLERYTPEDQGRTHPGDRGFDFVPATVEKEIIWPARSFRG
jgi:hypothetical protein